MTFPAFRPAVLCLLSAILAATVTPWFLLTTIILILDIRARMQDYFRYEGKPWNPIVAFRLGRSWCGRGVAKALWPKEASPFYNKWGYRWWHIFPDNAPRCFLRVCFWRSVVGV